MITKDYSIFAVALELMRREAKQQEMQGLELPVASFPFNKNKFTSSPEIMLLVVASIEEWCRQIDAILFFIIRLI